jgi:hypothetical protein
MASDSKAHGFKTFITDLDGALTTRDAFTTASGNGVK